MRPMRSFVVRLWAPGTGPENQEGQPLRGVVARVADGETHTFASAEELVAFLTRSRDEEYGIAPLLSAEGR